MDHCDNLVICRNSVLKIHDDSVFIVNWINIIMGQYLHKLPNS